MRRPQPGIAPDAIAIAHAFGHLLLGPGAHTGAGLMRSRWTSEDFDAAAKRRLRFDGAQAQRIRSALEAPHHHSRGAKEGVTALSSHKFREDSTAYELNSVKWLASPWYF